MGFTDDDGLRVTQIGAGARRCPGKVVWLDVGKEAVTFLKKSNQKTFAYGGLWQRRRQGPQYSRRFFASFFSKKEALAHLP
jgi:hypothetical protein